MGEIHVWANQGSDVHDELSSSNPQENLASSSFAELYLQLRVYVDLTILKKLEKRVFVLIKF
jgi:hypothetical protein